MAFIHNSVFYTSLNFRKQENDGIKKGLHVDKSCKNKNGDMVKW